MVNGCHYCSGLENLIKTQKDKLAELQEYLRAKEADLEKVSLQENCHLESYMSPILCSDQGVVQRY